MHYTVHAVSTFPNVHYITRAYCMGYYIPQCNVLNPMCSTYDSDCTIN